MSNQTVKRNKLFSNKVEVLNKFYSVKKLLPATYISSIAVGVPIKNPFKDEKNQETNKSFFSKDISNHFIFESKINEYFSSQPSIKSKKSKEYAAYITSTKDVFKILELANTSNFVDSYDSAVNILVECDKDVLINALNIAREKYISDTDIKVTQSWSKKWEILIQALTYASKIEPYTKMLLLLSLCDPRHKLSRSIKLSLIDAIVNIDIDIDLAKVMLEIFMSKRELDDFVVKVASSQPFGDRILGKDKGLFTVPKNFDDPLPEDIQSAFED